MSISVSVTDGRGWRKFWRKIPPVLHLIFEELRAHDLPGIVIHGDFAPWNIRYKNGELSGIFDFDLCHLNHRVADFALSWRGKHDDVIRGYQEVHPLSETDLALLTPAWWTWILWGVREDLQKPSFSGEHELERHPHSSQITAYARGLAGDSSAKLTLSREVS